MKALITVYVECDTILAVTCVDAISGKAIEFEYNVVDYAKEPDDIEDNPTEDLFNKLYLEDNPEYNDTYYTQEMFDEDRLT